MPGRPARRETPEDWKPITDPESRYSSGIPDFDRLLGGGFPRGSHALFRIDESVGLEDLDLILFPTYLNFLYQSRGMIAVLPARDSPHGFRERLTRYASRRRFDSRVRVVDYIGEDEGPPYVVNVKEAPPDARQRERTKARERALAKVVAAERAVQGGRHRPFLELAAFEVFETLMGTDKALKTLYYGIKRAKMMNNLAVGILGPGLGCSAGIRRMSDTEFELRREEVGLVIRGVRPSFPSCVVTPDRALSAPHVAFVPQPN